MEELTWDEKNVGSFHSTECYVDPSPVLDSNIVLSEKVRWDRVSFWLH